MDENRNRTSEAARKRRFRWSVAISLIGLSLVAIDFGVAIWGDCRRKAGKPISPAEVQIVRNADALMPPGLVLFLTGFAGIAANSLREKPAPQD